MLESNLPIFSSVEVVNTVYPSIFDIYLGEALTYMRMETYQDITLALFIAANKRKKGQEKINI